MKKFAILGVVVMVFGITACNKHNGGAGKAGSNMQQEQERSHETKTSPSGSSSSR